MRDLTAFCTPIRSGLGNPAPAGSVLSARRADRLREDLAVLAAERGRALAELGRGATSA